MERIYIAKPDFYGIGMVQRHINRYKWAMELVKIGGHVLDAACGSGYGGHILLNTCQSVLGIDKCGEAVEYARMVAKNKKLEARLSYDIGNVADLTFPYNAFDDVVSIETIEHLDDLEQCEAMEGFLRILKPEGSLLITTPPKQEGVTNTFHKSEFTAEGFSQFLKTYFADIKYHDPKQYGVSVNGSFVLAECRRPRK